MRTDTKPMTLSEFWELPDPPNGGQYELHHGRLILRDVVQPVDPAEVEKAKQLALKLPSILTRATNDHPSKSLIAFAVCSREDLAHDTEEREIAFVQNCGREFWTVFPHFRTVRVSTPTSMKRYSESDSIPLSVVPGASIAVKDIFEL